MAKKIICNVCGKEFEQLDELCGINLTSDIGYGSVYDGKRLDIDVCRGCFDSGMKKLFKECKINPLHSK